MVKFDLVVGNPPYNNDMYLDFVIKGHELSNGYSLWITPLKMHSYLDDVKFQSFISNTFNKYVNDIVYYPREDDIFNICMPCGVGYFLMTKNSSQCINIKNVSTIKQFNTDFITPNKELKTFNLKALSILDKIKDSSLDIESYSKSLKYKCFNRGIYNTGAHYGLFTDSDAYVIPPFTLAETSDAKTLKSLFSSDNIEECESFISYTKTKFIRFLLMLGCCGYSTICSNISWRFVPTPDAFDHIFTDEELYKKYNLTDEEISIIESVIKERT